jgi:hypothetical protein
MVMYIAMRAEKMAITPEIYADKRWNVKVPVSGCRAKSRQHTHSNAGFGRRVILGPFVSGAGQTAGEEFFCPMVRAARREY